MRKLSARWVPRFLTVDQKRVRMNISNAPLAQFRRNKSEFWRRLISVDETWIYHYTLETFSSNEEAIITFVNNYFAEKNAEYYLDGLQRWKHP